MSALTLFSTWTSISRRLVSSSQSCLDCLEGRLLLVLAFGLALVCCLDPTLDCLSRDFETYGCLCDCLGRAHASCPDPDHDPDPCHGRGGLEDDPFLALCRDQCRHAAFGRDLSRALAPSLPPPLCPTTTKTSMTITYVKTMHGCSRKRGSFAEELGAF